MNETIPQSPESHDKWELAVQRFDTGLAHQLQSKWRYGWGFLILLFPAYTAGLLILALMALFLVDEEHTYHEKDLASFIVRWVFLALGIRLLLLVFFLVSAFGAQLILLF